MKKIRKVIILGSIFVCFIMLMIPNINAIKYNNVTSDINEEINPLNKKIIEKYINLLDNFNDNEKINILSSLVKKKYISLLDRPVKNEKANNILNQIDFILESICFPCVKDSLNPKCMELFVLMVLYIFVGFILFLSIVGMPITAYLWFYVCPNIFNEAKNLGCLWAGGIQL